MASLTRAVRSLQSTAARRTARVHHIHFPGCGCADAASSLLLRRTSSSAAAALQHRSLSTSSFVSARIGFIGLGHMGGHMAHNLLKAGNELVVYDLNADSLQRVQQQAQQLKTTVTIAQSPKEVVLKGATTIVTMLPSSPHVKSVYTDPSTGIIAGLREQSQQQQQAGGKKEKVMLIDSSTIDPSVAREVSSAAIAAGAEMIDAPVSGGVGGAEAATLTFMCGGSEGAFAAAKESVLSKMGKNIVHCGSSGNGQVAKVCNNVVLGMSMVAVAEGMALGVKLGMEPKKLAGIFNTSSARCWSSDTYNPCPGVMDNVPSSRGYTGGFGTALMLKDMGLAVDAAKKAGQYMPLANQAKQVYEEVVKEGNDKKDFSFVYEHLRKHSS